MVMSSTGVLYPYSLDDCRDETATKSANGEPLTTQAAKLSSPVIQFCPRLHKIYNTYNMMRLMNKSRRSGTRPSKSREARKAMSFPLKTDIYPIPAFSLCFDNGTIVVAADDQRANKSQRASIVADAY